MNAEPGAVLIVDDEEWNSDALARRLQRHGYTVAAAKSGREAIELLGERRFDLVLLDVMMPEMNGLQVLELLRRVDSLLDLPIIMVTAKGESEDVVEAFELGANDYVTKPLDIPVVLARIRTQLALKRAVSQVADLEQKLTARNKDLEAASGKLTAVNKRLADDLEAARRAQKIVLPALPAEVAGVRFAWTCQPCEHLAGDFLDVFRLDDRHLGLCILGGSGQGVSAILLSLTAGRLLARLASPSPGADLVSPSQVVGQLSKQVSEMVSQHFTLLYGILALNTGDFRFVSAGHPGPIHLPRDSPPVRLEVTGFPIGVGNGSLREQVVNLRPGDRLVLYTAGVTEARNVEGEHFGARRFLAALEQSRRAPLDQSRDALVESVSAWGENAPRQRDLSLLFVERTDPADAAGSSRPSIRNLMEKRLR